MENRRLFGRPRRRKWPRKMSPFVKVTTISDQLMKSDEPISSSPNPSLPSPPLPPLPVENIVATVFDCLRESLDGFPMYEFSKQWLSALLYFPFETAATVGINIYAIILNLPPFVTLIVLPLALLYILCRFTQAVLNEYQNFMDLGRGGTPSTPMGLIKVTLKAWFANVNVLDPPHVHPMLEPYRGVLFDVLKPRSGERPIVKGVAPQRQTDQKASLNTFNRLMQMLRDIAAESENLTVSTSYLEGHTDALKAVFKDRPHEVLGTDSEWDYEISHPHRVDGSLHAILHPEDVRTVIERGWGERHPLATDAWWWKVYYHYIRCKRRPVPFNLVLVYAPRNPAEYKEIKKVVDAAVWYHFEKDVCDQVAQGILARDDDGGLLTRDEAIGSGFWVDGPDSRLITIRRAVDRKFYKFTPCGTGVVPTFATGVAPVAWPYAYGSGKCDAPARRGSGAIGGCCGRGAVAAQLRSQ